MIFKLEILSGLEFGIVGAGWVGKGFLLLYLFIFIWVFEDFSSLSFFRKSVCSRGQYVATYQFITPLQYIICYES